MFQHRHLEALANIVASLPKDTVERTAIQRHIMLGLQRYTPNFNHIRFARAVAKYEADEQGAVS